MAKPALVEPQISIAQYHARRSIPEETTSHNHSGYDAVSRGARLNSSNRGGVPENGLYKAVGGWYERKPRKPGFFSTLAILMG
jgi:hypothetical protein